MSVHIYKYGLQWLYGRNASSGINAWFCAYCVHFTGTDKQATYHLNFILSLTIYSQQLHL